MNRSLWTQLNSLIKRSLRKFCCASFEPEEILNIAGWTRQWASNDAETPNTHVVSTISNILHGRFSKRRVSNDSPCTKFLSPDLKLRFNHDNKVSTTFGDPNQRRQDESE
jgi:hypothetical protein